MKNKILVPLNDIVNIQSYIAAGADEFYLGFYDDAITEEYGAFAEINRMSGFRHIANKYDFSQAMEVVKVIKDTGKDVFITLNAASYKTAMQKHLYKYMAEIAKAGANGVIVSTPELVKLAKNVGLAVVASTMCGIYNSDIVKVYKDLGVKRMILPRDLSIAEISDIVSADPDIDYEVFLMRNGCIFSDSHCLGTHRPECGSVCYMLNNCDCGIVSYDDSFAFQHDMELNQIIYKKFFHRTAVCGLCALYRFVKLGIAAYKIVGRADSTLAVEEDIRLVKNNIEIAKHSETEEQFLKNMVRIHNSYDGCKLGFGCYYPEIRF